MSSLMKESFRAIPKVIEGLKDGSIKRGNHRDYIPCCRCLKETSSRRWYTKNINKKTSVVIMAICPYESKNRLRRLTELRREGTFLRYHKRHGNVWHGYPFRDAYNEYPFYKYLLTKGIIPIHSGCKICPIRIIFDMTYEGDKSILYYKNVLERDKIKIKKLPEEIENFKKFYPGEDQKLENKILNVLEKKKIFIGLSMLCRYLNGRGYIRYGCNAGYLSDNKSGNAKISPCPVLCPKTKIIPPKIRYWVMKLAEEGKLYTIVREFYDSKNPYSKNAPMLRDKFRFITINKNFYQEFIKKNTLEKYLHETRVKV